MNDSNTELTIMLSQFGRHEFSGRFFAYLNETECSYPILYADGDADGFAKEICVKYKDTLNIQLVEYKQSQKFKDYFTMMVKGLETIKTPYVMLCDNDDFIVYSSIEKLLKFLRNNSDYVSAGSNMIHIQLDNFSSKHAGKTHTLCNAYTGHRIEEPLFSWEEQVNQTFLNFQPNFYNIHKTDVLLQVWREILESDFSDLTIMEFFYQLRVLSFGKQYTDPSIVHYIRQSGTGSWQGKTFNFSRELVYNNLPRDIRIVADRMAKICSGNFGEDYHRIYTAILDSYAQHLNNFLPHNVLRYRFPRIFKIKLSLLQILDKLPILARVRLFIKEFLLLRSLKRIMGQPYTHFIREVKTIKNIVTK